MSMKNQLFGKDNSLYQTNNTNKYNSVQRLGTNQNKQFWQPRSVTKFKEQSIMMIPCINCEEFIPINQIDKHSFKCTTVSKRVLAIGKSPQLFDEIDFKIQTLSKSLFKVMDHLKSKESPLMGEDSDQKVIYLSRACEIAAAVVLVQNLTAIEERKLNDVEQELNILSQGYQGSLGVALYMERLHSLILQKLNVFTRQQQNKPNQDRQQKYKIEPPKSALSNNRSQDNFFSNASNDMFQRQLSNDKYQSSTSPLDKYQATSTRDQLKNQIAEKKQEVIQMKNMATMYQQSTQISQAQTNNLMRINTRQPSPSQFQFQSPLNKNPLFTSRVQSPDLNGRPTLITKFSGSYDRTLQDDTGQKSQILTQMGSSQWQSEVGQFEDNSASLQVQQNGDQIQRLFYSKCLGQKMKLPANHPAQKIPVSVLFKEIQQKCIQQAQWDSFISLALQSPYEYLDVNKIASYNNQKILKNNLREMTQDSQFRNKLHQL